MSRRQTWTAMLACVVGIGLARDASAARRARVAVLDDGAKVMRDADIPMEPDAWQGRAIDLFAMRGETVALQVAIEAGDAPVDDARVIVEPFVAARPGDERLRVRVDPFVERFVTVVRPSGNDGEPGSLAFTERGAPRASFVGDVADPLVPAAYETARALPHERAAIWIDLAIPMDAPAGVYQSAILVRDARGELAVRPIVLRVLDATLPYAATSVFVYYDTHELVRRMGDATAEGALRAMFHAHGVSAIHDLDDHALGDARLLDRDRDALMGTAYTRDRGYDGWGEGSGEGILALGAYGSLGEPSASGAATASRFVRSLLAGDDPTRASTFLYSIDEDCASDWPSRWLALLHADSTLRGVRVGATCGDDAVGQAADLVLQTPPDYDPARARIARETRDQWVWAYNGRRPAAGAMMLDVPATDLRANAWIAMRYGVPRWFYWESTFWFDGNRGGQGGENGFDPFVVAETFHNADGDHANGDGILVYPGTQPAGMTDHGVHTVFPSIRLKNLRRGIQDAGYLALARALDPTPTDEILRRRIPRALAFAGPRVAWSDRGRDWLEAREALAQIVANAGRSSPDGASNGVDGALRERVSEGCSIAMSSVRVTSATPWGALFIVSILVCRMRRRARRAHDRACIEPDVHEASEVSESHAHQTRASD